MKTKVDVQTPKRISVPQGTELQIYSRDAHGNHILYDLSGPLDVSVVPISKKQDED